MDDLVVAYTRNLSRGGMRLRTSQEFPLGSQVEVRIELPDGAPEIRVPCEVVDVHHDVANQCFYLGARFIDPNETTRRRLEWYILNSEPAPGQLGGESPHSYRLKILIVEDETRQREAAARPFLDRGDDVRLAIDGLDALGKAINDPPDVVLTDVQMPKMDGWQLLRMLRSRPALARVPVLFLTTLANEADRLKGYRLGVDDYIPKPPEPDDLRARVDRAAVRALQLASGSEPPAGEQALRGDLEQVGVASLLSFIELERMSGTLRVGPDVNGRVLVSQGRPVQVFVDTAAAGESARERLFRLLDLREGRFEFTPREVDVPDEVKAGVSMLLLEHARVRDEQGR